MELEQLKEMAELHPGNPRILREYADALMGAGHIIHSRRIIQRLFRRLTNTARTEEAHELMETYGKWVCGEEETLRSLGDGPFLLLNDKQAQDGLLKRSRRKRLKEGEVLFRAGEPSDAMYLVLEGELAIFLSSGHQASGPTLLNLVRRGDLVGMSVLIKDRAVRTADVFANSNALVLQFNAQQAREALARYPELESLIEEEGTLRERITGLGHNPAFLRIPLSERIVIAEQTTVMRIHTPQILKEENQVCPFAAVILSGEVECYFQLGGKQHYSGSLYSGSLIGAEKVLGNPPTPNQLVAKTGTSLLTIPRDVLEDIADASPEFLQTAKEIAEQQAFQDNETVRVLHKQQASRDSKDDG